MFFEQSSADPLVDSESDIQNQSLQSFFTFLFGIVDSFVEEHLEGF